MAGIPETDLQKANSCGNVRGNRPEVFESDSTKVESVDMPEHHGNDVEELPKCVQNDLRSRPWWLLPAQC